MYVWYYLRAFTVLYNKPPVAFNRVFCSVDSYWHEIQLNLHVCPRLVSDYLPQATMYPKQQNFPVKAILLETRVNDHLSKAIGTTFWGDGFIIFHCTCKKDCIFFTPVVNCATIYHIFNFELACESIRFFRLKFLVSRVKLET